MSGCRNEVEQEILSPDGKMKAVLFNRGCGATVGFIAGVSILGVGQKLSDEDKANVLLADGAVRKFGREDKGNIIKGDMFFSAKWLSNNELEVSYPRMETYSKYENVGEIKITYKVIDD